MDYIIIIGYFGLIAMALLVSLYGNELISETVNFLCQGLVRRTARFCPSVPVRRTIK